MLLTPFPVFRCFSGVPTHCGTCWSCPQGRASCTRWTWSTWPGWPSTRGDCSTLTAWWAPIPTPPWSMALECWDGVSDLIPWRPESLDVLDVTWYEVVGGRVKWGGGGEGGENLTMEWVTGFRGNWNQLMCSPWGGGGLKQNTPQQPPHSIDCMGGKQWEIEKGNLREVKLEFKKKNYNKWSHKYGFTSFIFTISIRDTFIHFNTLASNCRKCRCADPVHFGIWLLSFTISVISGTAELYPKVSVEIPGLCRGCQITPRESHLPDVSVAIWSFS